MAEYIRFEMLIPTYYTVHVTRFGKTESLTHETPPEIVQEFVDDTMAKYHGVTQSNPYAAAPYKGWWKATSDGSITIDYSTYVFGLIQIDKADIAKQHFTDWKARLEQQISQDVILVMFYPVQTIGDFFNPPAPTTVRTGTPVVLYDKQLVCKACGTTFTFTAGEQEFFIQKGFEPPGHCPPCRQQRSRARAHRR